MRFKRVGVLMGGMSAERDISLASGKAVAAGLRGAGFDVVEIDVGRTLDQDLRRAGVEAVFIALHGRLGEDGTVQGLLEVMGIPYTGSAVLASALAMNKAQAKLALAAAGLAVPEGISVKSGEAFELPDSWTVPIVVKPADDGSSVGVTIVKQREDLNSAIRETFTFTDTVLVERFIAGHEITVTVIAGTAWGATEIETSREFYDFKAKYAQGGSRHHTPPRSIPADRVQQVLRLAERAYRALDCAGQARVDFIVPDASPPVVLEVNTIPGMTPTSLLPEVAAFCGISFNQFVEQIMDSAALSCQPKPRRK